MILFAFGSFCFGLLFGFVGSRRLENANDRPGGIGSFEWRAEKFVQTESCMAMNSNAGECGSTRSIDRHLRRLAVARDGLPKAPASHPQISRAPCRNERSSPSRRPLPLVAVQARHQARNRSDQNPNRRRSSPNLSKARMSLLPPSPAGCRIRSHRLPWRILPTVTIPSACCWKSRRKVCRWAVLSARPSVKTLLSVSMP